MKKITILAASLFASVNFAQEIIVDGGFDAISDASATNKTTIAQGDGSTTSGIWYSNPNFATTLDIYNGAENNAAVMLKPTAAAAQIKQNFTLEPNTTYVCSYKVMKENDNISGDKPLKTYIRLKAGSVKQPVNSGVNGDFNTNMDEWWIYRNDISSENFTNVSFEFTTDDNATSDYHIFVALPTDAGDSNLIVDDYSIVEGSLSNNDLSKFNFSYAPNPANNVINLKAAKTISTVEFFNNLGQNVLTTNVNALNSNINISTLNKGIYMMNVTIAGQTQAFKILKQ